MKFIHILIILFVIIAIKGCSLTEKPENQISPSNFFQTQADAIATINGAYDALQETDYYGRYIISANSHSGGVSGSRSGNRLQMVHFVESQLFNQNRSNIRLWPGLYEGIKRANTVLLFVPEIEMDADLKTRILGEAYFLRGMHFLNLARLFGAAPVVTELAPGGSSPEDLLFEKSPVADVYAQAIADLEEAIMMLDPKSETEVGRASIEAAQALLMRVYWSRATDPEANQSSDWTLARDLGLGLLTAFTLEPDFANLFGDIGTRNNNPENLFEVSWARIPGEGHDAIHNTFVPNGSGIGAAQWGTIHSRIRFWNSFSDDDLRKPVTFLTEFENGDGDIVPWWEFNIPAPHFRKWIDADGVERSTNPFNQPVVRGADVLLMLAEAINEIDGGPANAYQYIDQVRARAGISLLGGSSLSQDQFRDSILLERRRELVNEGHEFADLSHFGPDKFEEIILSTAYPEDPVIGLEELINDLPSEVMDAINASENPQGILDDIFSRQVKKENIEWDDHNSRWAIPQNAVDVNPNLAIDDPYRPGG